MKIRFNDVFVLSFFILVCVSCKKETIANFGNTNQEIQSSANTLTIANISSGLVAYYPFDGNANDQTINANHGNVIGATLTTDRKGNSKKAYSFNGTSNYISLPKTFFNGQTVTKLSYSVWFKVGSLPVPGSYFTISDKQGYWREVALSIGSKGDIAFWWTYPNPQAYYGAYSNSKVVILNKWNNYIVTMDGMNLKTYLNGVLMSNKSLVTNGQLDFSFLAQGNSTNTNLIGATSTVNPGLIYFMKGSIDDFRIYDRALNNTEIAYLAKN